MEERDARATALEEQIKDLAGGEKSARARVEAERRAALVEARAGGLAEVNAIARTLAIAGGSPGGARTPGAGSGDAGRGVEDAGRGVENAGRGVVARGGWRRGATFAQVARVRDGLADRRVDKVIRDARRRARVGAETHTTRVGESQTRPGRNGANRRIVFGS